MNDSEVLAAAKAFGKARAAEEAAAAEVEAANKALVDANLKHHETTVKVDAASRTLLKASAVPADKVEVKEAKEVKHPVTPFKA